ncbi:methyltransferase protein, partial [Ascosphaera atra]
MEYNSSSVSFVIGHHESKRDVPVSLPLVQLALDTNVSFIASKVPSIQAETDASIEPILGLLSSHLANLSPPTEDATHTFETSQNYAPLTIPPLTPEDSDLSPNEASTQVIGVASTWVDLCSPDPLIADVSRQVLSLEVAYAAFCGIPYLIVPGPKLHHGAIHGDGVIYFARAMQEATQTAPYMRIHVWFDMVDGPATDAIEMGDLSPFARSEYLIPGSPSQLDLFGTWEAWDTIRKICKYNARLVV